MKINCCKESKREGKNLHPEVCLISQVKAIGMISAVKIYLPRRKAINKRIVSSKVVFNCRQIRRALNTSKEAEIRFTAVSVADLIELKMRARITLKRKFY